jgi:hypothetical protein
VEGEVAARGEVCHEVHVLVRLQCRACVCKCKWGAQGTA